MSSSGILIVERHRGWSAYAANTSSAVCHIEVADPAQIASAVLKFAADKRLSTRRVVLAPATLSCFFAVVDSAGVTDRAQLRYALEAVLPIDAEQIVADSPQLDTGKRAASLSAVAIEINRFASLVGALEARGAKVWAIVPLTLLAAEEAIRRKAIQLPSMSVWYRDDESAGQADIVQFDESQSLTVWRTCDAQPASVQRELQQLGASRVESPDVGVIELARAGAASLIAGHTEPSFDLRRDELAVPEPLRRYRGAITALVLAGATFVAVTSGVLAWHARNLRQVAADLVNQQTEVFRQAVPGQRPPAAILGRLRSEHAKLIGISQTGKVTTAPIAAIDVLGVIVASLPPDVPTAIKELRIENGSVIIQLQVSDQADAGRIAAAIQAAGFETQPPATTLGDDNRLTANIVAKQKRTEVTP